MGLSILTIAVRKRVGLDVLYSPTLVADALCGQEQLKRLFPRLRMERAEFICELIHL